MYPVGQHLGIEKLKLLPDGSGHFTRRMGMLINKDHLGFGMRSWRYAAVVDDGKVVAWFEEPGSMTMATMTTPYGKSAPEKVLGWLRDSPR